MTAVSTAHSALVRCSTCAAANVSTAAVVLRTHSRSSGPWLALHVVSQLQGVAKWLMPRPWRDGVGAHAAHGGCSPPFPCKEQPDHNGTDPGSVSYSCRLV